MKTELTKDELETLQDALAYKLLYLKDMERTTWISKSYTIEIVSLIAKLEAMKEERDADCIGTKHD